MLLITLCLYNEVIRFIKNTWQKTGILLYKILGPIVVKLVVRNTRRTRVLLLNNHEVLLCRSWFSGGRWNLPGGGLRRNEAVEEGARREVLEEVGIDLQGALLHSLGEGVHTSHGSQFRVLFLSATLSNQNPILSWPEIVDAQWFGVDDLPQQISGDALEALKRNNKQH